MKPLFFSIVFTIAISVHGQSSLDTATVGPEGIQSHADSVTTSINAANNQQVRKIKIIKKDIHYSPFIKLAIGMMVFIAVIITTSQNYNPTE